MQVALIASLGSVLVALITTWRPAVRQLAERDATIRDRDHTIARLRKQVETLGGTPDA
ncbi:hypothetical protein HMPREF0063_10046 [Aeromicrobium marinum DSM 15272]|uniref:Uncharacterized protein n=1 Tax=Aeromicrobium marinum DSM 15272 TaxID=585531 RepID=E2S7N9_9ACTN|nr:hypothetical protein HMPREF0063_10046 [Aeromicrobium marinum DSM 15272]